MTPDDLPPSRDAVSPDDSAASQSHGELDWNTIDQYLAGTSESAEPADIRVEALDAGLAESSVAARALSMLQEQPAAGHVVHQFLQALEPHDAAPTSAEKDQLRARLRQEIETSRAPRFRRLPARASRTAVWMRTAIACVMIAVGVYGVSQWQAQERPIPQRIHTTSRGERATIQLADGSTVVLGAQSKLRYGHPFGDNNRDVYLEGEAYFTVAQHSSKPFVVYTEHSATQVLGTTFDVKAYSTMSQDQIVVTDGKVAFRPRNATLGSGTTLVRGDLAQINASGLMTVTRNVLADRYASWTRGQLTFNNVSLQGAIEDLERWYDITVVLSDSSLGQSRQSFALDIESIDQAMSLLADVHNLTWTRSGSVITFSPKHRP